MSEERYKYLAVGSWRVGQGLSSILLHTYPMFSKSTLLKHIKVIDSGGYNDFERESYKQNSNHLLQHHPIHVIRLVTVIL